MFSRYTMPFGKYKGMHFDEVPADYFYWLLDQDWLSARLRQEIEDYQQGGSYEEEYFDFQGSGGSRYTAPENLNSSELTVEETADFKKMIKAGYRALAFEYHPDKGGTKEAMQRLNGLADKLRVKGLL